jgi:hypothetical protein
MSTATTRRAALRSGVAALAAGLAAPAIASVTAVAPDADAELIAAVADMAAAHAWNADHAALPANQTDDAEDERVQDAWWEAADRIEALPATTPAGMRAKASAMRMAIERSVIHPCRPISEGEYHERLAYGLAADILGSAAA